MREVATASAAMIVTIALAALLGGAAVSLTATSSAVRVAAALLVALTLAATVALRAGRRRLLPVVVLGGLGVIALLAWHLYVLPSPVPWRSLHIAAVLSWGVVLLAGSLKAFRLLDWGRGLLLGYSLALPLLIVEMLMPAITPQQTPWIVTTRPDADTGYRYAPSSTAQNVYPDNPRGYFDQTQPARGNWTLETHGGSEAGLEFVEAEGGAFMRITIPKLVERQIWHVKLQQAPLSVTSGRSYAVSFDARSDARRPVGCAIGQNHEPWEVFGNYHEFEIDTEWGYFVCPVTANSSDTQARLFFDLGKSDATVELRNVAIQDEATGERVTPPAIPPRFVVNYRFNSLGLRGPDRAIPAPPGTFRIVALGDSYTLGHGVKEEDTVTAQLEKRLNAAAATSGEKIVYEVINDGVSGYDTRQERMSFEKYSSKYAPQIVLLLMVFNDDLNYNEDLKKGTVSPSGAGRLFNIWGSVQMVKREYDFSGSLYQVRQLNESVKQRGAKLVVAIFRNSGSAPWMKLVEDATTGLKGTGIPVLDLGVALLDGKSERPELAVHAVDGHPNEIAHGIAAEALERFLRSERLIK